MNRQLKLLKTVTKLLQDNNIEYFLDCGTLLGAVREHKFLSHDSKDIDIGLKQKDYWKVRKLIDNQCELKYKNYWRAEITVCFDDSCHLDMFFYTDEGDYIATQACLGNPMQKGINIESETRRLKENIYPLKKIKLHNKYFPCANNPKAVLKEHYGEEWKIPKTKWFHEYSEGLNPEHRTIGILITTFLRDEKMMKEVESILQYCDSPNLFRKWIRIYIADQGNEEWSQEKTDFYNKLKAYGHKVFKTPFNSGLSYNRNFLVKQSTEPYLMIIDDDFEFSENTNLTQMIEILNHKEKNGIVGGDIEGRPPYHAIFEFEKKGSTTYLHRIHKINKKQSVKKYNYYYSDIVLNFFLAKREVLEDIPLDNELKLVEHSDHMLRIKKDSDWKVCYCPDVTCKHQKGRDTNEYRDFRHNHNYVQMFLNKWGLNKESNVKKIYVTPISEIKYGEIKPIVESKQKKIKVVQIARIPCANSGYEVSKLLNTYSNKYESRYILGSEYSKNNKIIPFRQFPYDILWSENKEEAIKVIQEADIIHIHHDSWKEIEPYLEGKRVVSTLYNLTQSLQYKDNTFNNKYINKLKSFGHITVADQPLQKKMFSDISLDTVPLVKMMFGLRIYENGGEKVVIGFAPTNKNPQGIGSKRYDEVMEIINKLKQQYDFEFKFIEGLPYEENLREKAQCDIIIDDVDDRYEKAHNTTIEAGLLNAIPLTNYSGDWYPAYQTNITTLEKTLRKFLEHPERIEGFRKNVLEKWRIEVYNPQNLLKEYERVYNELILNITKNSEKDEKKTEEKVEEFEEKIEEMSFKQEYRKLHSEFEKNGIQYCLQKTTCLDAIRFGETRVHTEQLFLAVDDIAKAKVIYQRLNLKTKVNFTIKLPSQMKQTGFFGVLANVPYPVISYLQSLFGSGAKWKEYGL